MTSTDGGTATTVLVVPLWLVVLFAARTAAASAVPVSVKLTDAPVDVVAVTV